MGLIRVRKLKWETFGDQYKESNAESAYGLYRIWHPFDDHGFMWMLLNKTNWQPVESLEAAIAACQADFERRVLAEIEVPPLVWTSCHTATPLDVTFWRNHCPEDGWEVLCDDDGWCDTYDSLAELEAACNAHNRRLILGETQ